MTPAITWNPETPAHDDAPSVTVRAYPSPKDRARICGHLEGGAQTGEREATFFTTPSGQPFPETLRQAVGMARQYGIPEVRVEDPDGLIADRDAATQAALHSSP